MTIRWDALLVTALARELTDRLGGARVRALHFDRTRRSVLLFSSSGTLVLNLHPDEGGAFLLPESDFPPEARRSPMRLRLVEAPADDRNLEFRLRRVRGRGPDQSLVIQLRGPRANAVLVDLPERVIRRVLRERPGSGQELRVGHVYAPPPPPSREGIREPVGLQRWLDLLLPVREGSRQKVLLSSFAWTSAINAPSFLGQATGNSNGGTASGASGRECPPDEEDRLSEGWKLWARLAGLPPSRPCLLEVGEGRQPYPYPLPHLVSRTCASLLEAFGEAGASDAAPPEALLIPQRDMEALRELLRRAENRLIRIQDELEATPDPGQLRGAGSLLLARLSAVPRGVDHVTLEGFEGEPRRVSLDPALQPHENAQAYFQQASRAERARRTLPGLLSDAKRNVEELQRVMRDARRGALASPDLRRLLGIAEDEDRTSASPGPLPYRRYLSSGGLEIRVGRGAKANDDLTFRHARGQDVWLHARHVGGAHVILRWEGRGSPPAADLEEAAILAALHSKARTSGTVPVDWTRRKYVSKPRGSPPGSVVPERVRTVFVHPDPELGRRLEFPAEGITGATEAESDTPSGSGGREGS